MLKYFQQWCIKKQQCGCSPSHSWSSPCLSHFIPSFTSELEDPTLPPAPTCSVSQTVTLVPGEMCVHKTNPLTTPCTKSEKIKIKGEESTSPGSVNIKLTVHSTRITHDIKIMENVSMSFWCQCATVGTH